MRIFLALLFVATACFGKPNIIFIMCDDRGLETCIPDGNANGWDTPNIDSLADSGMRFESMFSELSCAASRAMLLTGRYPSAENRLDPKITNPLLPTGPLDTNEVTVADILGNMGYNTVAIGKWNLRYGGNTTPERIIEAQNHAKNLGFNDAYFPFVGTSPTNYYDGTAVESNYIPYKANQYALNYLDENYTNTFFMYYCPPLIHTPYHVTPLNPGETDLSDSNLVTYMYKYLDLEVSNIVSKVQSLGIATNTIIVFTGDNGTDGALTNSYNGTDVPGGKTSGDDTGSRVQFYVRWDGVIATNSTYSGVSSFADFLPTLAEIAESYQYGGQINDGVSFYDGLLGNTNSHRSSFYQNNYYRDGEWKYQQSADKLISVTNWPFGDDDTTLTDVLHTNVYTKLKSGWSNAYYQAYDDRPWYGSTNTYILSTGADPWPY